MKGLLFFGAFALLAFVSCKDIDVPYVPEDTPEETHDEARPGYSGSSPATGILETPDVLNLIDQKIVPPLSRQVRAHVFIEVVSGGYIVIFLQFFDWFENLQRSWERVWRAEGLWGIKKDNHIRLPIHI